MVQAIKLSNFNSIMTRLLLVTLLMFSIVPFAYGTTINHATSEDSGSNGSTNLDSISVSMNEDGSVTVSGISDGNSSDTWQNFFDRYRVVIAGVSGVLTMTFILFFLKNFAAIGANSNNPQRRNEALAGCIWTGLAAAGSGAVTLIVGLFWNFLR